MRDIPEPGRIALGRIHIPDFQAIEVVKAGWPSMYYSTGLTLQNAGKNNLIPVKVRLVESKNKKVQILWI